jgi:hypothetical protein
MLVPVWNGGQVIDEDGKFTPSFSSYLQQTRQQMQQSISNDGFLIPSVSSTDLLTIQANPRSLPGTLLFNRDAANGGAPGSPNGQLYIKLLDGIFHPITNT